MMQTPHSITLRTPDETASFATRLGAQLTPGDCLLLGGTIGSGKTHFARNLIQSLMAVPEDVPSPTFTLVQVYDTQKGEVWHSDLYRLSAVEELEELGLTEAFDSAICLIEWPEKLGPLRPDSALTLTFSTDPDHEEVRQLSMIWSDPKWSTLMEKIS